MTATRNISGYRTADVPCDIDSLLTLAETAGRAIMEIYAGECTVEFKEDRSPLTAADKSAHAIITAGLHALTPGLPVLSEEGSDIPFAERRNWQRFWLVDPLDGTKEFLKHNGEFTVNIAMIHNGQPVVGVVGVPAQNKVYLGIVGTGSWLKEGDGMPRAISVRPADHESGLTVVQSRSHPSPELSGFLANIKVADAVAVGSALKFCIVAEGRADLYPRLGPTMEWDTAAGQAVVVAAGGRVTTLDGQLLRYNKENLLNPHFVVSGY